MIQINVEILTHNLNEKLRKALAKEFHVYLNKAGVFVFKHGSDEEARFRTRLRGSDVSSGTVITCSRDSLHEFPFFHFHAMTHASLLPSEFILSGSGCLTEEPPLCWIGSAQDRPIPVDTDRLIGLDLVSPDFITSPAITVVSRRCKILLQEMNVTGCRFVPCIDAKNSRNSSVHTFSSLASFSGVENADFYQLVISASVRKLPCVGRVLSVGYTCPKCGAVGGYSATRLIGEYYATDLNECDFQVYHGFRDEDGRQYTHKVERVIVSSRVLRAIADAEMKGLARFASDPMIYSAVVIRDQ